MKLFLKGYRLSISSKAKKNLKKISSRDVNNILAKLKDIVSRSGDFDVRKLNSFKYPCFRLRCGVYRVIFDVQDKILVLLIVDAGHRKEIYKRNRR